MAPRGEPTPAEARSGALWRLVARALLRLYPSDFRDRYGQEILDGLRRQLEEDHLADAAGLRAGSRPHRARRTAAALRALFALARSGLAERVRPTRLPRPVGEASPVFGSHSIGGAMDSLLLDLRQALRSLRRRPGFVAVVIATLAVAMGASTAIFSVVHGVLWRPLPYPAADSLVTVERWEPHRGLVGASMSLPDVDDLAREVPSLDALVAYRVTRFTRTGGERPEVLSGARTSGGLLGVFGLAPVLGRDLDAADVGPGAPPRVLVSWGSWQERLGGDEAVVGRSLELDGQLFEVVGVAPRGFDFPQGTELWAGSDLDTEDCGRGCHLLRTVGRLALGASLDEAHGQIDVVAASLQEAYPEDNFGKEFRIEGLRAAMVGEVHDGLLVLLVAVLCVMLVATANVANLILAQGIERRDELAMRATLGAGGGRLVRLLVAEAGVLALGAGALGVGLAVGATRVLVALAPATTPRLASIRIDATVLAFTLLLALGSALVFGLVPALRLALDSDGRGLVVTRRGTSRSPERARGLLLMSEVAVSLVLLVAAGLLLRSFQELVGVRLGFDPDGVTSAFFALPESRYDHPEKVAAFFAELEPRLLALPGVTSVGSILGTPFGRNQISAIVEWDDRPAPPPGQEESVAMKVVSPGYFETLRIPLVAGRGLSGSDRHDARPVVLVNEAFARRYHPDGEAIGTVLRLGVDFGWAYEGFEVVGVVADTRSTLAGPVLPEIFVPQAQMAAPWLTVLARSAPGVDLLPVLEATVAQLDPDLPLHRVEPLAVKIERQRGPSLLYLTLVGAFAAIALLLAAVGLYGVVAYVVSRRTREIAIRIAVGAEPTRIFALVVRQGMAPVLAGLAAGLLGSLLVRRLLDSLLYNVAAIDGLVLASVSLLLLGVAATATAVPALRASRLAPAQALAAD